MYFNKNIFAMIFFMLNLSRNSIWIRLMYFHVNLNTTIINQANVFATIFAMLSLLAMYASTSKFSINQPNVNSC